MSKPAPWYCTFILAIAAATAASPAFAQAGDALPESCGACHALDKAMLGPSYRAIAEKYAGQDDAASQLATAIREGASGTWSPVPMMPVGTAQLSDEDLADVVRWILAQH